MLRCVGMNAKRVLPTKQAKEVLPMIIMMSGRISMRLQHGDDSYDASGKGDAVDVDTGYNAESWNDGGKSMVRRVLSTLTQGMGMLLTMIYSRIQVRRMLPMMMPARRSKDVTYVGMQSNKVFFGLFI